MAGFNFFVAGWCAAFAFVGAADGRVAWAAITFVFALANLARALIARKPA